jgi:signal transduction histidine kinase
MVSLDRIETVLARSPVLTICIGLVMVFVVGVNDYLTGPEIAFSIFYLIPIILVLWYTTLAVGLVTSLLSACIWLLADLLTQHQYSHVSVPFWNACVRLGFFCIVAYTLHRRKEAGQRVIELMDARSKFISIVSHELRTPLTSIKEGIGIVLDGTTGSLNPEQEEFLLIAKRNIDRLARLINVVLDYQKMEAGRLDLSMQSEDINAITLESAAELEPEARARGLGIDTRLQPDLPFVSCDRDRIHQVLANLLSNAIKFTPQGVIELMTASHADGIRVSVRDKGPGIRPENQALIFRPFSQLPQEGPGPAGGTGLGLVISRKIIEAHGGHIGVVSEDGKGAEFYFVLPLMKRTGG